ncbi:1-deoxy-D-xylulose-5-phosphate synthase [Wohlfahrtiimonas chitiniclastica]|uniref:1-deoxy-D-xylulose-5-phosphate synthase n=1 Tax=Wohlfahrtiimonas chitiniclastica TaxID=400946 RepID=A0AB35BX86_9GAMM|nr:1-deoxy-D-xylulose-5-phosphate synthase [Wohlfahrtiimonas chitiniclastica]KZS23110.1 1-deoxy-D-xylulose-5-phosphate synthase [Wohlfahrtiimonas chitiniclastica]MBS7824364.1 1-deoxy-D-xylulose-5-phosphate synthase [Wohlfahrtiimonas chitiniclastica]MBS7839890.1 1-deoxy-D-xylulose-5-phosphate synthase [Wohlfahrtiimonas chitiniclastica]MDC7252256.1 1-deoxy-D-xylulose-5-phosphate synthase [Wohlfahrtiimonas chitiniclastica]WHR55539.1 1-deoxy-D-xylulose-5-phosphate synthase [Wohlfahrtiimonas chitin
MSLLNQIQTPQDLKRLSMPELEQLTAELRQFLIDSVLKSGGHFASGLGVIELTVALHYVFDAPNDAIIWDVGHQAYPHKILTERREQLNTIRQKNGLKPFPCPKESRYDAFTVGHSSTSVSAALGMSIANQLLHNPHHAVAVIGDGALTAGMAFEALNHAGAIKADMLVILNDNNMSISPNVGALSNMLTKTLSNPILQSLRTESKRLIEKLPLPHALELAKRTEEQIKSMVAGDGGLFEALDFQYFGPVNGHDLPSLIAILNNLKQKRGPKLLHLITQKGKGYTLAESAPIKFHAVSAPATPKPVEAPKPKTYTQIFSQWICDAAARDHKVVAITPAMREGSGLVEFEQRFPKRFFDVAIAEQHAVTIAAGMQMKGLKPVVAIYSTFLQRGYDQLIHDVALQDLPIVFAIDRAGVVGPDGPTHIGAFDLAYLRIIPNMVVMAPSDENEQYHMLNLALTIDHPTAVRYPRGSAQGIALTETSDITFGKGRTVRAGHTIAIFATGTLLHVAKHAAEVLNATLIDLRFVKPLDQALILEAAKTHDYLISIEDGVVTGGVGSAILELLAQHFIYKPFKAFGLPDEFLEHGERNEVLEMVRLTDEYFLEDIQTFVEQVKLA